jgi:Ca2+-binding RTX toxin-like protein
LASQSTRTSRRTPAGSSCGRSRCASTRLIASPAADHRRRCGRRQGSLYQTGGDVAQRTDRATQGNVTRIASAELLNGDEDNIAGGLGNDRIFGGNARDTISDGMGSNIVFGDKGLIDFVVFDADINDNDLIESLSTTQGGGADNITINGGNDIILGGVAGDTITANFGETPSKQDGENIVLGTDIIYENAGDDNIIGGHNVVLGYDSVDYLDGGTGDDVIAGDNAEICFAADPADPRMRALEGTQIYGVTPPSTVNTGNDGLALVTGAWQSNPDGTIQRHVILLDHADDTSEFLYGSDYIAGGADDDLIFGQVGDDVIQGDGTLDNLVLTTGQNHLPLPLSSVLIGALRDSDNERVVLSSFEAATAGDDSNSDQP